MQLETSYAGEIIAMLEDAQDIGYTYVVFASYPSERELRPTDLNFFDRLGDALDHWEQAVGMPGYGLMEADHPTYYIETDRLLEAVKKANGLIKEEDMNYNNLENLKDELSKLGFGKKVADDMQKQMEKGGSEFQLHDRVMGNKGQVDLTLHFRQSGQSENYYFNKFEVSLLNGKPLAEGEKYMVVNPDIQKDSKPVIRSFERAADAIEFFKAQRNNAVLASGKDWAHKTDLARTENGNTNYVEKDFARTFKNPGINQTVFVERGKGFTAEHAVNLIQGRAVFRDDLLKLGGEPYAAWNKLDMDSQKDRYHNFQMLQYHVPTFGFDLEKTLEKFNIKELNDDKKREQLIHSIQQGNRPLVTLTKDGEERKLFMEVQPRYSQANFFREDGKPEKREQFLKPEHQQEMKLGKEKGQSKAQEQGLAV
ncbi:hypothetical protein FHW88_000423 [Mucilaginibacter sp. SG538B]|uniref:hypothetical protein n=1 Tax=Mucilaginibacter sp. SG538B TaxID=2587021 RepID=UPI0017D55273|nr:hypothetical protein [Mucilaginibacter sp. SG538B]NVM62147.1 hypothetical protein [Mucilaginibacter sp. SG538B]